MRDFEDILRDAAGGANLSPDLLWAVGQVESNHRNFDAQGRPLRSPTGPMGRWQFTEETGRRYGAIHAGGDDRLNDEVSTPAAAHLLSDLIDKRNGDVAAALRAYNGGGDPQYVNKVFAAWRGRLGSSDQGKSTMPTAAETDTAERWKQLDREMPVGGADQAAPADQAARWRALDAAMPPPGAEPAKPPQGFVEGTPQWQAPGTAPDTSGILTGEPGVPLAGLAAGDPAGAPGRILAAGAEAAGGALGGQPIGMTPETRAALARAGILGPGPVQQANEALINPLVSAADLAAMGFRGAQGMVAQTGAELGQPQLGRDIAAMPEAFPLGPRQAIGPAPPPAPAVNPVTAAIADRFSAGQAADQAAANRLIGDSSRLPGAPPSFIPPETPRPAPPAPEPATPPAAPSFVPPSTPRPAPGSGEPPPNSVGAMGTPSPLAAMREAEIDANRHQAEVSRLQERQPLGATDDRELVPGITPTMAQREQTVSAAREQKGIAIRNTEASQMEKQLLEEHNAARVDYYHTISGSPAELERLHFERGQQAERDLRAAFGAKRPTDASDALGAVDGILRSPRAGERDTVQSYIAPIRDKIARAMDDNGMADPERLYGIREDVAEKLGKANRAKNPDLGYVERELIQIKDALDTAIEAGAEGYRQYLTNYHNSSKIIDAFDALQTAEKGLIRDGKITLSGMNRLLANVVEARKPGAPLNQWRYLPESKLEELFNLRDDLRRATSADQLAAARGSDTAQNMVDFLKDYGTATVMRGIGSIPLVGPALRTGREMAEPALARRRDARDLQQMNKLLRPPPANRFNVQPPPP